MLGAAFRNQRSPPPFFQGRGRCHEVTEGGIYEGVLVCSLGAKHQRHEKEPFKPDLNFGCTCALSASFVPKVACRAVGETRFAILALSKRATCAPFPMTHCVRAYRPHAEIFSVGRLFSTPSSPTFKLYPEGVEPFRYSAPLLPLLVPIGDRSDQCLRGRQCAKHNRAYRDGDYFHNRHPRA